MCIRKTLKQKIFLTNRTKEKAKDLKNQYPEIEILDWGKNSQSFDLVINTTSVGLKDNEKIDLDFNQSKGDNENIL